MPCRRKHILNVTLRYSPPECVLPCLGKCSTLLHAMFYPIAFGVLPYCAQCSTLLRAMFYPVAKRSSHQRECQAGTRGLEHLEQCNRVAVLRQRCCAWAQRCRKRRQKILSRLPASPVPEPRSHIPPTMTPAQPTIEPQPSNAAPTPRAERHHPGPSSRARSRSTCQRAKRRRSRLTFPLTDPAETGILPVSALPGADATPPFGAQRPSGVLRRLENAIRYMSARISENGAQSRSEAVFSKKGPLDSRFHAFFSPHPPPRALQQPAPAACR